MKRIALILAKLFVVCAALGLPKPWLDGALRLSFSPASTQEEADQLVEALNEAAATLFTTLS